MRVMYLRTYAINIDTKEVRRMGIDKYLGDMAQDANDYFSSPDVEVTHDVVNPFGGTPFNDFYKYWLEDVTFTKQYESIDGTQTTKTCRKKGYFICQRDIEERIKKIEDWKFKELQRQEDWKNMRKSLEYMKLSKEEKLRVCADNEDIEPDLYDTERLALYKLWGMLDYFQDDNVETIGFIYDDTNYMELPKV